MENEEKQEEAVIGFCKLIFSITVSCRLFFIKFELFCVRYQKTLNLCIHNEPDNGSSSNFLQ